MATLVGLGTIFRSSDSVRFVQGGVVKIFRWTPHTNRMADVPSDDRLVADLISLWYETRTWAEKLLCDTFDLQHIDDFMPSLAHNETPRTGQFPNLPWSYRVHGIGIDISKSKNRGGIDFDFDKPQLDRWRLREFMVKQLNDGSIPARLYRPLVQDTDRWSTAMDAASIA